MPSSLLTRDRLSDQVARYLQGYIGRHHLKPGDPLPSEMQVSKDLGVSRGIVREAFRSLASAGIIEVASGKGAWVSRIGDETFTRLLRHAIVTEQITPEHILELRRAIEVGAVRLAVAHITKADLAAMRQEIAEMQAALGDVDRFVQHDVRFHRAIARATGNPLFLILVTSLREPIEASIREGLRRRSNEASIQRIHFLHGMVVDALATRDVRRVEEAMNRHFDEAIDAIVGRERRT